MRDLGYACPRFIAGSFKDTIAFACDLFSCCWPSEISISLPNKSNWDTFSNLLELKRSDIKMEHLDWSL